MRRKLIIFFAILAICALFTPIVSAHSPVFPGNNTSLDSAYVVNDPTKSWALYTTLQPGQVQYYRFDVTQGESIYVQLYKNTEASNLGFLPSFVLMGPGLTSNGTVPANVAVPQGASNIVMQGQQPDEATYEGFGPGSFYDLGSVEVRAPRPEPTMSPCTMRPTVVPMAWLSASGRHTRRPSTCSFRTACSRFTCGRVRTRSSYSPRWFWWWSSGSGSS